MVTDSPLTDALEATSTGQLPALMSTYFAANSAQDLGATLRSYECVQESDFVWLVTATYSSEPTQTPMSYNPAIYGNMGGGGGLTTGNAIETDPLLRAPTIHVSTLQHQKATPRDLDNKPFTASNGQRFDPPVMSERAYMLLVIERNESVNVVGGVQQFTFTKVLNFQNKVNSVQWSLTHLLINGGATFNIAAGLAKCESITAQSQVEQSKIFWRVRYEFHINPNKKKDSNNNLVDEGWQPEILDAGTYEYFLAPLGGGLVKRPIVGKMAPIPVTSPVPLDGTGKELAPTGTSFPPTFAYKYQSFRTYDSADFNQLALP